MAKYKPIKLNNPKDTVYLTGGETAKAGAMGAAGGAATGAAILPPYGAIVGAVVGGTAGVVKAQIADKKERAANADLNTLAMGSSANYNTVLAAGGGTLDEINTGGSHESNPNGGIPVSINNNGGFNKVEQGETMLDNFVYSDRLTLDNPDLFSLPKRFKGKTFAQVSKSINKISEERPNDKISSETAKVMLDRLKVANTSVLPSQTPNTALPLLGGSGALGDSQFALGGETGPDETTEAKYYKGYNSLIRTLNKSLVKNESLPDSVRSTGKQTVLDLQKEIPNSVRDIFDSNNSNEVKYFANLLDRVGGDLTPENIELITNGDLNPAAIYNKTKALRNSNLYESDIDSLQKYAPIFTEKYNVGLARPILKENPTIKSNSSWFKW